MPRAKLAIAGGPAEGMQTAPGRKFVWLDVVVLKRRERTPTAGLYELTADGYHYIGGTTSVCGCGAYVEREGGAEPPACPLCGAQTKAAA